MKLASVQRPVGATNQVHQALRRAVLQADFRPGEKLVETQLATMLGVSRTPVREALSKLIVEGLVEPAPTGGVVVCNIEAEIVEIYGLRQRIEGYAASLAADRRTEAELAELERLSDLAVSMIDSTSLEERADINNQFHMLLTEASHSARLAQLVSGYRDYFLNRQFMLYYDRESVRRQHEQHRDIVEAVRDRNADLAERLVRDHLQRALEVIQRGIHTP